MNKNVGFNYNQASLQRELLKEYKEQLVNKTEKKYYDVGLFF